MKFIFKIMKDENGIQHSCEDCQSEVPLCEFASDRETKLYCAFCSSIAGNYNTPVDKAMLCAGLNELFKRIKNELRSKAKRN